MAVEQRKTVQYILSKFPLSLKAVTSALILIGGVVYSLHQRLGGEILITLKAYLELCLTHKYIIIK